MPTNCTPLRQMTLLLPYQLNVFTPSAATDLLKPNTQNYLSSISQKILSFHVKKEQVFRTWISSLMLTLNLFTLISCYIERHIRSQIVSLYNEVTLQQCELEHKVLESLLRIARLVPSEFALRLMKEPSYIAHVTEESTRIIKCIPVEVETRKTNTCCQEPSH